MIKHKKLIGLIMLNLILILGCTKSESIYFGQRTPEMSLEESKKILEESYFLPLGSVVVLTGNERVMIVGILSDREEVDKDYLFTGIGLDEGIYRDNNKTYLFDVDDIKRVVHLGFISEDHLIAEGGLLLGKATLNEEPIFTENYVGLRNYPQDPLSKEESEEIKKEFKYLPIGSVVKHEDNDNLLTIIGYLIAENSDSSVEIGYVIVSGIAGEGNSNGVLGVKREKLSEGDILKLGYMGEEYYQIVEEIEKSIDDNKAELENPTSTPEEEIVRDNPIKLMFEQEGILTELEIYHEDGKVLRHEVTTTATYEGIIKKREEVSNKEEVKRFFAEIKAVFDETAGVEYTVNYEGEILIEYIVFNYAELAPEIGLSLPGVIIEGGGIDADLETVIKFFKNAGLQEVEE